MAALGEGAAGFMPPFYLLVENPHRRKTRVQGQDHTGKLVSHFKC